MTLTVCVYGYGCVGVGVGVGDEWIIVIHVVFRVCLIIVHATGCMTNHECRKGKVGGASS